jgi:hypothetical protein
MRRKEWVVIAVSHDVAMTQQVNVKNNIVINRLSRASGRTMVARALLLGRPAIESGTGLVVI